MAIGMGRRNPKGEMIPMSTKAADAVWERPMKVGKGVLGESSQLVSG